MLGIAVERCLVTADYGRTRVIGWSLAATSDRVAHALSMPDPATESRPLYSSDGAQLAFISTRTGGGNIYLFTFATGDLRRLTYSDQLDRATALLRPAAGP